MDQSLPPVLEAKLADFRRRVWTVKLAEAILAALFGIVLSYLLVFVLDRVCETPGPVRGRRNAGARRAAQVAPLGVAAAAVGGRGAVAAPDLPAAG